MGEQIESRVRKCNKKFWNVLQSIKKSFRFYDLYSAIVSKAKYEAIHGEGLKILSRRQILQRLTITLAQVKPENTSENVVNKIRQIISSFYREK